jgi:hypothetical protein
VSCLPAGLDRAVRAKYIDYKVSSFDKLVGITLFVTVSQISGIEVQTKWGEIYEARAVKKHIELQHGVDALDGKSDSFTSPFRRFIKRLPGMPGMWLLCI